MKKQHLLFLLLTIIGYGAVAQQRPHYTQYLLNNYILNPALSGIENYTDIKLSIRDQWVGLNGAPRTMYFSIQKPIGKEDYKSSSTGFDVPGENPRGTAYWSNYTASDPHHGVGMIMMNDRTGNLSRFTIDFTYAYHMGLSPTVNLAAGVSAGVSQMSYDRSKATPDDPNDPALGNANILVNKFRPDINAGLWLYSSNSFIGIAAQQIVPQKFAVGDDAIYTQGKLIPHLFATAGYRFLLTEDINAIPSIMTKYVVGAPTPLQFDLNAKFQYQDMLWVGGGYRIKDGYNALLGVNIAHKFNVSYSYDFTITPINTASHGTHELMLGFILGNTYGDTCPRNMW